MAIISCGAIDQRIIIPIFGGLFKFFTKVMYDINPKEGIISENPLFENIYISIGMFLAFIPYLIIKYKTKKPLNKKSNITQSEMRKTKLFVKFEYYDKIEKTKYVKYRLIFLSSFFHFFQSILVNLLCYKCIYNLWFLDIIFLSLFSFIFLKTKLYNHQYLSILLIIFSGLILNVVKIFQTDEENIHFLEIFGKFLAEVFFCLGVVVIKYNMAKTFCTPYEICFLEGIINIISNSICLFVFNKLNVKILGTKYPNNFNNYFNNFNMNDLLMASLLVICGFFYHICIFITCDNFTATHSLLLVIIHESYPYFKVRENIVFNIICFFNILLILFMYFVFIEIIELNFCSFSINTKRNIGIRAKSDSTINLDLNEKTFDNTDTKLEEEDNLNNSIKFEE